MAGLLDDDRLSDRQTGIMVAAGTTLPAPAASGAALLSRFAAGPASDRQSDIAFCCFISPLTNAVHSADMFSVRK